MTERVLFVDDDPQILNAFRRGLRKRLDLHTAEGGKAGLEALEKEGPFAVVVSDQQMPEMDGITLLREVKNRAPLTVRMMLTGNADQGTAAAAVNEGHIFRFLTKPCTPDELAAAVEAAKEQYRLVTAERDLLEKTLAGSVKVLVDVLALNDPEAFKETGRLQAWGNQLARHIKHQDTWALNMATMLVSLGRITLPNDVAEKLRNRAPLSKAEQDMVNRTPEVARDLIANIPRLGGVAEAVYYQAAGYNGSGFPADGVAGPDLPFEARVLKILTDLAATTRRQKPSAASFATLEKRAQLYDPTLLAAARACLVAETEQAEEEAEEEEAEIREVTVRMLSPRFRLAEDVTTETGVKILASGLRMSPAMIKKIQQYHALHRIKEPIYVVEIKEEEPAQANG